MPYNLYHKSILLRSLLNYKARTLLMEKLEPLILRPQSHIQFYPKG